MKIKRGQGYVPVETGRYLAVFNAYKDETRKVASKNITVPVIQLSFEIVNLPEAGQFAGCPISHTLWIDIDPTSGAPVVKGKNAVCLDAINGAPVDANEDYELDSLIGNYCYINVLCKREGDKKNSNIASIEPYDGAYDEVLLGNGDGGDGAAGEEAPPPQRPAPATRPAAQPQAKPSLRRPAPQVAAKAAAPAVTASINRARPQPAAKPVAPAAAAETIDGEGEGGDIWGFPGE